MALQIDLGFAPEITPAVKEIARMAADRWSQIITGAYVPGVGFVNDYVHIDIQARNMGGPGGTLAEAGWSSLYQDALLPSAGFVTLDISDLNSDLSNTMVHEMGHALGIGTLWAEKGLVQGLGTRDPRFVGLSAATQYGELFGLPPTSVPVEFGVGAGSDGSHFRESEFGNELMTSQLGSGMRIGMSDPISRVTLGALEDLGYQVNYAAADPFTLPNYSGIV
jgi:hypothetical protein